MTNTDKAIETSRTIRELIKEEKRIFKIDAKIMLEKCDRHARDSLILKHTKALFRIAAQAKAEEKEICICAAVKTTTGEIFRGHRHSDCLRTMRGAGKKPEQDERGQGFMTTKNRYVDRFEAYKLQIEAGIQSKETNGYFREELYSEDLY